MSGESDSLTRGGTHGAPRKARAEALMKMQPPRGMQAGAATLANSMKAPQKVKKRATLQSVIILLRVCPPKYH